MARRRTVETDDGETVKAPTEAERKDKRAHDEQGNVRPADGRWELHDPEDESKYVNDRTAPVEGLHTVDTPDVLAREPKASKDS